MYSIVSLLFTRHPAANTDCLVLNINKLKHYVSEIKAGIKLCSSLFSVIVFPLYFPLGQVHLLGTCTW
jgi:hypothetical protein